MTKETKLYGDLIYILIYVIYFILLTNGIVNRILNRIIPFILFIYIIFKQLKDNYD